MEKAKVALIQFQLSPPKTDMENQVVINDYSQMDRVLKEERAYTLNLVKGPVVKLLIHLNLNSSLSLFNQVYHSYFILNLMTWWLQGIKKSGANVILCQKSILRDAVSDLAIHYLNKLKILVVKGRLH